MKKFQIEFVCNFFAISWEQKNKTVIVWEYVSCCELVIASILENDKQSIILDNGREETINEVIKESYNRIVEALNNKDNIYGFNQELIKPLKVVKEYTDDDYCIDFTNMFPYIR